MQEKVVLECARKIAQELEMDMRWVTSEHSRSHGYWKADPTERASLIAARAFGALEFFRTYAGPDSAWTQRANMVYDNHGDNQSAESGARNLGDLLRAWADQVEAGIVEIAGSRAWAEVGVVSTDIMRQVRKLLEDRANHPAAPIVLCGAALEIALRSVADAYNVPLPTKPTLSTLSGALRGAGILTVQDVKDLEQCGGVRNAAAHGDFDTLSIERAGLMELQTNLLLRRLSDLEIGASPVPASP